MENSSELDLEQRISRWTESLNNCPSLRGEDVEELESHLRDSIEQLGQSGLTSDEAFLVAARRAGSPSELERQYDSVNPVSTWRKRALWMTSGVLMYWLLGSISSILSSASLFAGSYFSWDVTLTALGGVAAQLVFFVGFITTLVVVMKRPRRDTLATPKVLVPTGVLLGAFVLLKAGQVGISTLVTSTIPFDFFATYSIYGICWNIVQTSTIIGIVIALIRSEHRAEQLE